MIGVEVTEAVYELEETVAKGERGGNVIGDPQDYVTT